MNLPHLTLNRNASGQFLYTLATARSIAATLNGYTASGKTQTMFIDVHLECRESEDADWTELQSLNTGRGKGFSFTFDAVPGACEYRVRTSLHGHTLRTEGFSLPDGGSPEMVYHNGSATLVDEMLFPVSSGLSFASGYNGPWLIGDAELDCFTRNYALTVTNTSAKYEHTFDIFNTAKLIFGDGDEPEMLSDSAQVQVHTPKKPETPAPKPTKPDKPALPRTSGGGSFGLAALLLGAAGALLRRFR